MLKLLLTGLSIIGLVSCFTLHPNQKIDFPKNLPLDDNSEFFGRIGTNGTDMEILKCPEGFVFNNKQMKCTKSEGFSYNHHNINRFLHQCPEDYSGPIANPLNCRNYIDCFYGIGHKMECSGNLLFNPDTSYCDYPEDANCCEYWEKDPNVIVPTKRL